VANTTAISSQRMMREIISPDWPENRTAVTR